MDQHVRRAHKGRRRRVGARAEDARTREQWRARCGSVREDSATARLLERLPAAAAWSAAGHRPRRGGAGRPLGPGHEAVRRLVEVGMLEQVTVGRRTRAFEAVGVLDAFTVVERASPARPETPAGHLRSDRSQEAATGAEANPKSAPLLPSRCRQTNGRGGKEDASPWERRAATGGAITARPQRADRCAPTICRQGISGSRPVRRLLQHQRSSPGCWRSSHLTDVTEPVPIRPLVRHRTIASWTRALARRYSRRTASRTAGGDKPWAERKDATDPGERTRVALTTVRAGVRLRRAAAGAGGGRRGAAAERS